MGSQGDNRAAYGFTRFTYYNRVVSGHVGCWYGDYEYRTCGRGSVVMARSRGWRGGVG